MRMSIRRISRSSAQAGCTRNPSPKPSLHRRGASSGPCHFQMSAPRHFPRSSTGRPRSSIKPRPSDCYPSSPPVTSPALKASPRAKEPSSPATGAPATASKSSNSASTTSSGCLRTAEGGSSRQFLILHENGNWSARLITTREAARLMGAPDSYKLSANYNETYCTMGDAVAVPVVRHLAEHLLAPLAKLSQSLPNELEKSLQKFASAHRSEKFLDS